MKLTQNQKDLLTCIKNKEIRKEVKKEFKRKTKLYRTNWKTLENLTFKDGELETENSNVTGFLSQHPMNGTLFKEEFEKEFGEGFPWYETNSKEVEDKFNELGNEYVSPEKAIEGLKRKIILPTGNPILDIDFHLSVLETVKNAHKAIEQRKNDKFAEMFPKPEGKRINIEEIGIAEFTKEKYIPKNPLTIDQIETVIDWMNTWEQLKDTAIPIRFKEDFTAKKSDNMFSWYKGEFADTEKIERNLLSEIQDYLRGKKLEFEINEVQDLEQIFLKYHSKKYTEEDMRKAFEESRLTHSMIGFKHKNFDDYLNSLKNPS
jgi:hypothetical protein